MDEILTFENVIDPKHLTTLYDGLTSLFHDTAMKHRKEFINFVVKYIDKNAKYLYTMGPYYHVLFAESQHENPLYTIFGITKDQIRECVNECKIIAKTYRTLNTPFFHMLTALAMIYSESDDKLTANAKFCSIIYLAIRFYSARQRYMWPYNPDEKVMEYTINNLSNKYMIKNEKSVFGVLKKIAQDNDNTVGVTLRKNRYDTTWIYYITNVTTRISNMLNKLNEVYKENLKNKKYMNETADLEKDKESGDDKIKVMSNVSSNVISISSKVYNKIKNSEIDQAKLNDATTATKISVNSVQNTLEELIYGETDSLRKVIMLILQIFFSDTKNTPDKVKSKYFAVYCLNIYRISNTKNPLIVELKEILDSWLYKYGAKYTKLSRESTLINFRKAIYIYLVDCIIDFS